MTELALTAIQTAYQALDDKFGKDITVLDISGISVMADYFVIATASNVNQGQAMAGEVDEKLHNAGVTLNHSEGLHSSEWILLDFGSIIVHIFNEESRQFYNLERIWADAQDITHRFRL